MRPQTFDYFAPTRLSEALTILSRSNDAKILAGGQSILTLMKLRLAAPSSLIDINRIKELNYIREDRGAIAIGSLTRHAQLAASDLVHRNCELLAEAASMIADQQIRNRGSIGGSLAHADPSADLPTACTALNAQIVAASEKGSRQISADDFFVDFFVTQLTQNELIEEILIPIPPAGSGGAYGKLTKGHNDFALVAVACQTSVDKSGKCEAISVILGGLVGKPTHAAETERMLRGRKVDDQLLQEGVSKVMDGLAPTPDIRATPALKQKLAKSLAEKTIRTAFRRASGAE